MTNEKAIANLRKLMFSFAMSGVLHDKDVQEIIKTLSYAIVVLEKYGGGWSDD